MGIQFYNGLSNYRAYDIPKVEIPQVSAEEVTKQDNAVKAEEKTSTLSPAQLSTIEERTKTADLEDISLSFNKEETYDYIGTDASIKSLDMEKAISDMKKDSILQDYNRFVGSSKNLFDDGTVIIK